MNNDSSPLVTQSGTMKITIAGMPVYYSARSLRGHHYKETLL